MNKRSTSPSSPSGKRIKLGEDAGANLIYNGETFYFNKTIFNTPDQDHCLLTISEVLHAEEPLHQVVCSAILVDYGWMRETFSKRIPLTLCLHRPETPQPIVHTPEGTNWQVVEWSPGRGSLHAKLLLLRFETFVRVVVSSANLTDEWSTVQNVLWLQDFPRAAAPAPSEFSAYLRDFCGHLKAPPSSFAFLSEFNFASAKAQLVASVPGRHKGSGLNRFGHMRIRDLLARLGPLPGQPTLYVQSAHVGRQLPPAWLAEMRASCGAAEDAPLRVLYPTERTVFNSSGIGADMLSLTRGSWREAAFPQSIFRDLVSRGRSLEGAPLFHSKLIFRRAEDGGAVSAADNQSENGLQGWIYLGSHNFSQTALGALKPLKSGPMLQVPSLELGVLLSTASLSVARQWEQRLLFPLAEAPPYGHELPYSSGMIWMATGDPDRAYQGARKRYLEQHKDRP